MAAKRGSNSRKHIYKWRFLVVAAHWCANLKNIISDTIHGSYGIYKDNFIRDNPPKTNSFFSNQPNKWPSFDWHGDITFEWPSHLCPMTFFSGVAIETTFQWIVRPGSYSRVGASGGQIHMLWWFSSYWTANYWSLHEKRKHPAVFNDSYVLELHEPIGSSTGSLKLKRNLEGR